MANTTLTATLENITTLTQDERTALQAVKAGVKGSTLDNAEAFLRVAFSTWFVYRGGNHVALHRSKAADAPRVLLVAERLN